MDSSDFTLLALAVACDAVWALALWGHWPERVYEQRQDSKITWYWLRVFNVPQTQRNCVQFVRGVCYAGMALVTVASGLTILLRHR